MPSTFAETLALLADRGLRVVRVAPDRLQVVGDGDLTPLVAEQVREHRDEFLQLLPDPSQDEPEIAWDERTLPVSINPHVREHRCTCGSRKTYERVDLTVHCAKCGRTWDLYPEIEREAIEWTESAPAEELDAALAEWDAAPWT